MKRCMKWVGVWLAAGLLASCGGGGGGDMPGEGTPPAASTPPANGSPGGTPAAVTQRFEESDAAVTMSGAWSPSDSHAGWSGGAAVESTQPGAMAAFTFTGTSVRWLSSRGRNGGIALVRVDGGEAREVDLFARPNDEFHTPAVTIYGLSPGQHTLTIEVTDRKNEASSSSSPKVVVDAFEVEPQIVSHAQEADPDLTYSAGWSQASQALTWSGGGAFNKGEPPPGAKVTDKQGASVTFKFRGTSVSWSGYTGPDAGIALVSVDGGEAKEVDTYSSEIKVQQVVFTSPALTDAPHTLTIQATGRKNAASSGAKIFVDAFDVTTPGRRFEQGDVSKAKHFQEGDAMIDYVGAWNHSDTRIWTEGASATSNQATATVTFAFTGTSVSWIGCEKQSAGGRAKIFLDGVFVKDVHLFRPIPIEGFQRTIFRADGLANGRHELKIEVTSTDTSYVVIDAFDVHP